MATAPIIAGQLYNNALLTLKAERRSLKVSKGHDQIGARATDSVHLSGKPWDLTKGGLTG